MTQDEIIEMAQKCGLLGMRPHLDGIYIESLLAFAKRVEEKALAEHAMKETQRLGQEIEQEPYSVQQAYAMAQVCLDLHEALGCKWGDNPYLTINQLKASPPQRKPLTDKAITKVIDSMPKKMKGFGVDWDLYEFVRAIEAKLKEKNT